MVCGQDHDELLVAEVPHGDARAVRRGLGDPELDVAGPDHGEELRGVVGVGELHDDAGMGGPERADEGSRRVDGERGQAAECEVPGLEPAHGHDGGARGLDVAQGLAGGLEQRLARGRQPHPAPDPVEERHPELGLEGPDRLGQGGLRDVDGRRRPGHPAFVDDRDEHLEPAEIHSSSL